MSCPDFSSEFRSWMLNLSDRGFRRNQELGIVLEGSPERPERGETCTGTDCSIVLGGEGGWGTFHTHARTRPRLGCFDAFATAWRGHSHACVGGVEDERPVVRCYAASSQDVREAEKRVKSLSRGEIIERRYELGCEIRDRHFRQVCEIGKERKPRPRQTSLMRRKRRR